MGDVYRFDRFTLDLAERRLSDGDAPLEVSTRYLDALALLVREGGRLVTKDRFMAEVWRGVPVTDEALTQCIRSLRRCLGDEAANPRFIETVPKHGYRFVAPVEQDARAPERPFPTFVEPRGFSLLRAVAEQTAAGTAGAGVAGIVGGLIYGIAAAGNPGGPGALSAVAVVTAATVLVALLGAAGVASGIALARLAPTAPAAWTIVGGALGGTIMGAVVKLFGMDAFTLLVGRAPADITGPGEGVLLGAGVAAGVLLARRYGSGWRRTIACAALPGALAGAIATLAGGRLMAGSLDQLAHTFADARIRLDSIAMLLGEDRFGAVTNVVTGMLEGALFSVGVVAGMLLADRQLSASR